MFAGLLGIPATVAVEAKAARATTGGIPEPPPRCLAHEKTASNSRFFRKKSSWNAPMSRKVFHTVRTVPVSVPVLQNNNRPRSCFPYAFLAFFHSIPTASIFTTSKCAGLMALAMMSRDASENDITVGISSPASLRPSATLEA